MQADQNGSERAYAVGFTDRVGEDASSTNMRHEDAHDLVPRSYILRDRDAVRATVMTETNQMLDRRALDEETTDALDPLLLALMGTDLTSLQAQRPEHRLASDRIVAIAKRARDREAASVEQCEEELSQAEARRSAAADAFRQRFSMEPLPLTAAAASFHRGARARLSRHWQHILQYSLLLVMVCGDYALLSLTVLELGRSLSALGSIGVITKILTVVLSAGMIVLPHIAAIAAKNSVELHDQAQRYIAVAAGSGWLLLLVMITIARAVASAPTPSASTLRGASTDIEAWSPWSPDAIFAWLTAIVLIGSGIYAFWLAWKDCEPLAQRYRAAASRWREAADGLRSARVRHADTERVLDIANTLDDYDAESLTRARFEVEAFYRLLRAEVTTTITRRVEDPEATSHISRELSRLRSAATHPLHDVRLGGAA